MPLLSFSVSRLGQCTFSIYSVLYGTDETGTESPHLSDNRATRLTVGRDQDQLVVTSESRRRHWHFNPSQFVSFSFVVHASPGAMPLPGLFSFVLIKKKKKCFNA